MKNKFDDYDEYDEYVSYSPRKKKKETVLTITDEMIEKLFNSKVDNKQIFGYKRLSKDNSIQCCKYDKSNELFIVYSNNNIIQSKTKLWREFTGDKGFEYYDELE